MLISWSLDDTNTKTGGSFRIDFSQRSKLFLAADEANVSIEMQPEDFAQRLKKMDPHKRDPLPLHVTYVFLPSYFVILPSCFRTRLLCVDESSTDGHGPRSQKMDPTLLN